MRSNCDWASVEDRSARNALITSQRTPVNPSALVATKRKVELSWMENERIVAWTAARKVAWSRRISYCIKFASLGMLITTEASVCHAAICAFTCSSCNDSSRVTQISHNANNRGCGFIITQIACKMCKSWFKQQRMHMRLPSLTLSINKRYQQWSLSRLRNADLVAFG